VELKYYLVSINQMKNVPLSQGQYAMVPDECFEEVNSYKWFADWSKGAKRFYASRHEIVNGRRVKIYMHRQILKAPKGVKVDHRDGNQSMCVNGQRIASTTAFSKSSGVASRVTWNKGCQKWVAQIGFDGKFLSLGLFEKREDAAIAHDIAAVKHHGEFAALNFPEQLPQYIAGSIACPPNAPKYPRRIGKQANNRSGYIGVYWNKSAEKWQAQTGANGTVIYLGLFDDNLVA
jgi:hypothetical protein